MGLAQVEFKSDRRDEIRRGIDNLRRDLRAAELRADTSAADAIRVRIEELESELQRG